MDRLTEGTSFYTQLCDIMASDTNKTSIDRKNGGVSSGEYSTAAEALIHDMSALDTEQARKNIPGFVTKLYRY